MFDHIDHRLKAYRSEYRTETRQVVGLFALAILVRAALFDSVGVFGDYGFWAYDSRMITNGLQPFVDFPGRSPLMIYLLAVVREAVGMMPVSLRATVLALWTLTGVPVYLFARRVHDHAAGLAALGAFLLVPFPLVYGMFVNSQSLGALLAMSALYLVYRDDRVSVYGLAGALLAGAFLSRRTTIVYLGPIGAFTLWRRAQASGWLARDAWAGTMSRGAALSGCYFGTLLVGYTAAAAWDVGLGLAIFDLDFAGLFLSHGRGAYPMVGQPAPPVDVEVAGGLPIVNELCPACGAWTARRGLRMLILASPVAGLFFVYCRDVTHHYYSDMERQYMLGALAPLAAYGSYLAVREGFYLRFGAIVALVLFAIYVYGSPRLERDVLFRPGMALALAVFLTIVAGYLYRERRLIVYYMMDAWPVIAILAGVIAVGLWRRSSSRLRGVFLAAVVIGIVVSVGTAAPLADVAFRSDTAWFTMGSVAAFGDDISARTDGDDRVFAPHPTHVAASDALLLHNLSRSYQVAVQFGDAPPGERFYAALASALRTGEIQYVVDVRHTRTVFDHNASAATAVDRHFCEVPDPDLYETRNTSLYRYQPSCPEERQWPY